VIFAIRRMDRGSGLGAGFAHILVFLFVSLPKGASWSGGCLRV
jgi:hypothetical protein